MFLNVQLSFFSFMIKSTIIISGLKLYKKNDKKRKKKKKEVYTIQHMYDLWN